MADSNRQGVNMLSTELPTTLIVQATHIKTTTYISIPRSLVRLLDIRPRDVMKITVNDDQSFTIRKHANGPHHA